MFSTHLFQNKDLKATAHEMFSLVKGNQGVASPSHLSRILSFICNPTQDLIIHLFLFWSVYPIFQNPKFPIQVFYFKWKAVDVSWCYFYIFYQADEQIICSNLKGPTSQCGCSVMPKIQGEFSKQNSRTIML